MQRSGKSTEASVEHLRNLVFWLGGVQQHQKQKPIPLETYVSLNYEYKWHVSLN